jgi:hypothetical protein
MFRSARAARILLVPLVAVVVAGVTLVGAYVLENQVLPRPARGSLVALRASAWLASHRLSESVIQIGGRRPVHSRCASAWFQAGHDERARGSLVLLADGFSVLAVPPHTLVTGGGTRRDRTVSSLVDLELAGCTHFLARRLEAAAQHGHILAFGRADSATGDVLWTLRLPIDGTRLTLYLKPHSDRLLALSVTTHRYQGESHIRFAPLSAGLLATLERTVAAAKARTVRVQTAN